MKCPKCDLLTSDSREDCPRCGLDLRPLKTRLGFPVGAQPAAFAERPSPAEKPLPVSQQASKSGWFSKLLSGSSSPASAEKQPTPSPGAAPSPAHDGSSADPQESSLEADTEPSLDALFAEVQGLTAEKREALPNDSAEDLSDLIEALDRMGPGMDNADLSSADLQALNPDALRLFETYEQTTAPVRSEPELQDELSDLSWMLSDEEQTEITLGLEAEARSAQEQEADLFGKTLTEELPAADASDEEFDSLTLAEAASSEPSKGFDEDELLRDLAAALEAAVDGAGNAASALQEVDFPTTSEEAAAELPHDESTPGEAFDDEPLFEPEMLDALRQAAEEPKADLAQEESGADDRQLEHNEDSSTDDPSEEERLAFEEGFDATDTPVSEPVGDLSDKAAELSDTPPEEVIPPSLSSSDARVLSTKVTPEVLEFDDDDELLEEKLDAILEDLELNVEAVKVEKPTPPVKSASEAIFIEDDLEIAFEIDFEGDEEEEEALPLPSAARGEDEDLLQGLMNSFAEIEAGTKQQPIVPTAADEPSTMLEESLTQALSEVTQEQPRESLDTLAIELERELAGLMAEGTSFYGGEAVPLGTSSTPSNPDVANLTEPELPPELQALSKELEDELSALEGEGFSVFSLQEGTQPDISAAPVAESQPEEKLEFERSETPYAAEIAELSEQLSVLTESVEELETPHLAAGTAEHEQAPETEASAGDSLLEELALVVEMTEPALSSLSPQPERAQSETLRAEDENILGVPAEEEPGLSDALAELLATEEALSSSLAEVDITGEENGDADTLADFSASASEPPLKLSSSEEEESTSQIEGGDHEPLGEETAFFAPFPAPETPADAPEQTGTLHSETVEQNFAEAVFLQESEEIETPLSEEPSRHTSTFFLEDLQKIESAEEDDSTELPEDESDDIFFESADQEPLDTEDFSPIASIETGPAKQFIPAVNIEPTASGRADEESAYSTAVEADALNTGTAGATQDADTDTSTTTIFLTQALDQLSEEEPAQADDTVESVAAEGAEAERFELHKQQLEQPNSAMQTAVFFADDLRRILEEGQLSVEHAQEDSTDADDVAAPEADEIELDELLHVFQDEAELAPPPLPSGSTRKPWSKPVFAAPQAEAADNSIAHIDPTYWEEAEQQLAQPNLIETEISLSDICTFETGAGVDLLFEMAAEEIADPEKRRRHEVRMPTSAERMVNSVRLEAAIERYAHEENLLEQQREEDRRHAHEGLSVPIKPAAAWQRLIAGGTDFIVALAVTLAFGLAGILPPELREQVLFLEPLKMTDFLPYIFDHLLLLYAVWIGMNALLLTATGKTVGCRLARMEVMNSYGFPISFGQGLVRGMLQVLSLFSCGLFFLPTLWGKKAHLPDRLSRTQAGRRLFEMVVEE